MHYAVAVIISILAGYLVGSINPSYIIARLKGFDIRKMGSRNAGGSNAVITMGKAIGVLCIIFDILKSYVVVDVMTKIFPEPSFIYSTTGVSCILGHIFPFYMHFKGGKGLACLGGMILAFDWRVFVILFVVELIIGVIVDYICIVPITASIVYPAVYGAISKNVIGALILIIASVAIIFKHRVNLRRIKQGTELHLSYFWSSDKESEKQRIIDNVSKVDASQVETIWRDKK